MTEEKIISFVPAKIHDKIIIKLHAEKTAYNYLA